LDGSGELHQRLRQAWQAVAKGATRENLDSLASQFRERLQKLQLDSTARSFNLKNDAGAILECRLTGFIEQLLSCRLKQFAPGNFELVDAHEFFLILRDHVHRFKRSHLVAQGDLERVRAAVERELSGASSPDELAARLMRHRRRVRAGFKAAVAALEQEVLDSQA
jgi:hypothetical protein